MAEHRDELPRVDAHCPESVEGYEKDAELAAATEVMPRWHRAHESTKKIIAPGNSDLQTILMQQMKDFNARAMYDLIAFCVGRLTGKDVSPPAEEIVKRGDSATADMLLSAVRAAFEGDLASVSMSPDKAADAVLESAKACVITCDDGSERVMDDEKTVDVFSRELYRRLGDVNAIRAFNALTYGVVPDNRMYIRVHPDPDNIRRWFLSLQGDNGAWTGQLLIQVIAPMGYPESPPYFYVMTDCSLYMIMHDICVGNGHHHKTAYRPGMGIAVFMMSVACTLRTGDITDGIGINTSATVGSIGAASRKSHAFNKKHYPQVVEAIEKTSKCMYENMFNGLIKRIRREDDEAAAKAKLAASQAAVLGQPPARSRSRAAGK